MLKGEIVAMIKIRLHLDWDGNICHAEAVVGPVAGVSRRTVDNLGFLSNTERRVIEVEMLGTATQNLLDQFYPTDEELQEKTNGL